MARALKRKERKKGRPEIHRAGIEHTSYHHEMARVRGAKEMRECRSVLVLRRSWRTTRPEVWAQRHLRKQRVRRGLAWIALVGE